ncbi:MAG: hypothetical protein R6X12_09720 [bacterium]
MPVVFLKSGGTATCVGYTVKDGVAKLIEVEFRDSGVPADKAKQPEAVIALDNILYIIPGRL